MDLYNSLQVTAWSLMYVQLREWGTLGKTAYHLLRPPKLPLRGADPDQSEIEPCSGQSKTSHLTGFICCALFVAV